MPRPMRAALPLLLALPAALLVACAPQDEEASDPAASASGSAGSSAADACAPDSLPLRTAGKLTVGTDTPAYPPWFEDNDPTNGKGFESAVAYAVADRLGFAQDQVSWVTVRFNNSYAPGRKTFDFDINQISVTPAREKVVDFSEGYYSAAQAVITLKKDAGTAGSLADLKGLKLGAQTGTTSLTAIRDDIQPTQQPLVFDDTNVAKQALLNGQVDAIVADLPTAFFIVSAEIPQGTITGQFQPSGTPEEFGLLMEKDSGLKTCVDQAVASLKDDGTLAELEQTWLSETVDVPVLK